jgi:RNA polymerase sigma-70 factor, ECF subfamily
MTAANRETDERQQFTAWVQTYGKAVRGYLFARLRQAELADDLSQEVFHRAWRARERYREQGNARAYLLQIADRLARDHHRHAKGAVNLDEKGWKKFEPSSEATEPSQAALVAEQVERLTLVMDQLSPVQQRVLLLRYYGQLSFAEIAEIIECPLNTTLSHCHRGLQVLRKLLVEKTP